MGKFVKGDVVVIPFPSSDLSASKKRPVLYEMIYFDYPYHSVRGLDGC